MEMRPRLLFFSLRKIKMSKQKIYSLNYLLHIGLMLTIRKMFIILCLLCLSKNREYPGSFQNISELFFQTSAQVHCAPSQTEGRRKAFLECTGIDLSSKLFLTCGGNVKSAHHFIRTLPVGIGNTLKIFNTNQ